MIDEKKKRDTEGMGSVKYKCEEDHMTYIVTKEAGAKSTTMASSQGEAATAIDGTASDGKSVFSRSMEVQHGLLE